MLSECLASFGCDTAVWPAQANSTREWWRPLTQSLLRTLGIRRTWESSLSRRVESPVPQLPTGHLCLAGLQLHSPEAHRLPQKHNGCCAGQQASTFPNGCHQLPHRLCSQGELAKCEHGMVILESFNVIHMQNY